jgi:hypothetical protein
LPATRWPFSVIGRRGRQPPTIVHARAHGVGLTLEQKRTKETKNSKTEKILSRELLVLKLRAIAIHWSRGRRESGQLNSRDESSSPWRSRLQFTKLDKETRKTGGKKVGVGTIVDLKAIKNLDDIHFAVVRSQLKAVGRQHGLLLNFAKTTLEPKRVIAS